MTDRTVSACPFCGSTDWLMDTAIGTLPREVNVLCQECLCCGPPADTEEEAIDLWNHRPDVTRD